MQFLEQLFPMLETWTRVAAVGGALHVWWDCVDVKGFADNADGNSISQKTDCFLKKKKDSLNEATRRHTRSFM